MIDHLPFEQEQILKHRGFTLVEMLVAMAVLGLLVVMLAQVVGLTSQAISVNAKKLDAAGQARLVFDRLATDLAARPRRLDLATSFTKSNNGNDSLYFYSGVGGYTGALQTRQVAAIGYEVPQTAIVAGGPVYQLIRGATGTDWAAGGNPIKFLPLTVPLPNNSDYDVLASGVFRLEFCYLLNTGVMSNTGNKSDLSNVTGLVVALGVLDAKSLKIVSSTQLAQLSTALHDDIDTSGQCQDPLSIWNTDLAQPTFAPGVPPQVIQNIRLYQRTFYVP